MARIKGKLKHGLKFGKERLMEFELHDRLTAGMILEAREQAEKVVAFTPPGGRPVPVVVESPARMGALMLCQQVAAIGPVIGPLDYELLASLDAEDLEILNLYADLAAGAIGARELGDRLANLGQTGAEVSGRGRDDRPGGDAGEPGAPADRSGRAADGPAGAPDGAASPPPAAV